MSSRSQSVTDADRDIRQFLIRIAAVLGDALPETLVGLYVHGSLATGSFHRESSDIDLIAVSSRTLEPGERELLARALVRLSDERPMHGDIEVSVVQERYARRYEHPMPYELQYSSAYHEPFRRHTFDFSQQHVNVELAVQMLETRERGFTLVGPPPDRMFGPVPWHAYIAGLHADFDWAASRVTKLPAYAVLNACRILHGASGPAMSVLNKDEAGRWALQATPQTYHPVILDALNVYRGTKSIDDVVFDEAHVEALRAYVFERARPAFERAEDSGEDE